MTDDVKLTVEMLDELETLNNNSWQVYDCYFLKIPKGTGKQWGPKLIAAARKGLEAEAKIERLREALKGYLDFDSEAARLIGLDDCDSDARAALRETEHDAMNGDNAKPLAAPSTDEEDLEELARIADEYQLDPLYEKAQAKIERQAAEIDGLRKDNKRIRYYRNKSGHDQHEGIEALKAEIERQTKEIGRLREALGIIADPMGDASGATVEEIASSALSNRSEK